MSLDKKERLEAVKADLLKRWGSNVFRTLNTLGRGEEVAHIATGFPRLDQMLGIGGLPRGHLTQMSGIPTSGMSTLALRVLANAQQEGDMAAYLDLAQTFDADYAVRCGVTLASLLLVQPVSSTEALEIVQNLLAEGSIGVLVVDLAFSPMGREAAQLARLSAVLAHSPCALIFLTLSHSRISEDDLLTPQVAVRLHIQKERWLKRRQDVEGYRAQVTVLKNRFAPPNRSISLIFNGLGDIS